MSKLLTPKAKIELKIVKTYLKKWQNMYDEKLEQLKNNKNIDMIKESLDQKMEQLRFIEEVITGYFGTPPYIIVLRRIDYYKSLQEISELDATDSLILYDLVLLLRELKQIK